MWMKEFRTGNMSLEKNFNNDLWENSKDAKMFTIRGCAYAAGKHKEKHKEL